MGGCRRTWLSTASPVFTPLLIACGLLLLAAPAAHAQVVTRVIDGDTIVVQGVGTVRLIGVDTPETVDPRKLVEAFGREASDFTRRLTAGRVVRLEYDFERKDRYNRTLAYVYLADGTFVNAEIVRQGFGHAYTRFPFKFLDEFRALEREAREGGRGLWGGEGIPAAGARGTAVDTASDDGEQIVYVTRTGDKYHRAGCRFLARSQIPVALKNVGSHAPCGVCRPPIRASDLMPPR